MNRRKPEIGIEQAYKIRLTVISTAGNITEIIPRSATSKGIQ